MASSAEGEELSLVPYSSRESNEIFLRHHNAVVVYDEELKQLVLRGPPSSATASNPMALPNCPYCRRPLRHDPGEPTEGRAVSQHDVEAGFVNPNYFRMLQDISTRSPEVSRPPSPQASWQPSVNVSGSLPSQPPSGESEYFPLPSPSAAQGISAAAFSPNYFRRFFIEERELGRGGKGVVLLVKHVLDGVSLGHFACKRVPVGDDHDWLKKVLNEVQLLQHLSHQNLVSYRHVWLENMQLTQFGPSVPCAFILQQYCNAGDLHRYVYEPLRAPTKEQLKGRMRRRSKGQLDEPEDMHSPRRLSFDEIYSFFKDIASGLNYLHGNGFIHRDLKPLNCLLHETGKGIRVLVSDFGEAQMESMARKSTGATGTISYCAPEVLRPQYPLGPLGQFTTKSDIFSLGMILYFMCFAQLPYANADNLDEDKEDLDRLRDEIKDWGGFDDVTRERSDLPDKLYKFLERLLSPNPADRPTAEDILRAMSTGGALTDSGVHHPTHAHQKNRGLGVDMAGAGPAVFDDVRSGSRISPVESPMPSTPTGIGGGRWRGSKRPLSANGRDGAISTGNGSSIVLRATFPSNTTANETRSHPMTPTSSTLGHSAYSSSFGPSPTQVARGPAPVGLLPDAPHARWRLWSTFVERSRMVSVLQSVPSKTVLFIFKVFSITMPCQPRAPDPWILYPLVCLGALDFALSGGLAPPGGGDGAAHLHDRPCHCLRKLGVSIALLVAHMVVLFLGTRAGVICFGGAWGYGSSEQVVMIPADDYQV